MILSKYLDYLNKLVKDHPEFLNYEMYTSEDDEGNGFLRVCYFPEVRWKSKNEGPHRVYDLYHGDLKEEYEEEYGEGSWEKDSEPVILL